MAEIELEIGDVVEIGGMLLTVVNVEEGEVIFQIDNENDNPVSLETQFETAVPR